MSDEGRRRALQSTILLSSQRQRKMKTTTSLYALVAILPALVVAQQPVWAQCGGVTWGRSIFPSFLVKIDSVCRWRNHLCCRHGLHGVERLLLAVHVCEVPIEFIVRRQTHLCPTVHPLRRHRHPRLRLLLPLPLLHLRPLSLLPALLVPLLVPLQPQLHRQTTHSMASRSTSVLTTLLRSKLQLPRSPTPRKSRRLRLLLTSPPSSGSTKWQRSPPSEPTSPTLSPSRPPLVRSKSSLLSSTTCPTVTALLWLQTESSPLLTAVKPSTTTTLTKLLLRFSVRLT